MESFKLKAKTVERSTLYYSKYEYRVELASPHMFYIWNCKTIADYKATIARICASYDENEGNLKWLSWRNPKPVVEDWEYNLIENILNLNTKYKPKTDFTTRRENTKYCIYTSNIALVNEVVAFSPLADVSQVKLMPAGTITFKREPPAKYRTYMTGDKMPSSFKEEMFAYLERTPDVKPSSAFTVYLMRRNAYSYHYLQSTYFVDYNDDKNLMMMMLLFPGAIGKSFKLEKKV